MGNLFSWIHVLFFGVFFFSVRLLSVLHGFMGQMKY